MIRPGSTPRRRGLLPASEAPAKPDCDQPGGERAEGQSEEHWHRRRRIVIVSQERQLYDPQAERDRRTEDVPSEGWKKFRMRMARVLRAV